MGKNQPQGTRANGPSLSEAEANRRLDDITRLVSDWVWEVDQNNKIVFTSERVFEVLGFHPVEIYGRDLGEFIDFNISELDDLAALLHRPFRDIPGTATKKDGGIRHILISGVPVFNITSGEFEGARGTVDDVTDKIIAENKIRESEKRFKDFAETAADRFWETDTAHRFSYISPPINNGPHLASEALIGKTRWQMPVLDLDGKHWQDHRETLEAHQPFKNFHFQIQHDNGDIRHLVSNGTPQFDENKNFTGYRGTTDEETDQVLANEKIASIQQQFFTAIENFSEGFALWDSDSKFVYCNSYFRLTHPTAQQYLLPGETYEDFIRAFALTSDIDFDESLDDWVNLRLEEFNHESSTSEMFRNEQWVQIRKNRLNNGSTMVLYADITELKKREQALRLSESRLHLITNAIPAMIAYHDKETRFQFANKRFESVGMDPKKIIGQRVQDVFEPDNFARIAPQFKKALAGEAITFDNFFELKDGTNIYTQVSLIPDFNDAGEVQGLFALSLDITERKKFEEQIEKSNIALDAAQNIANIGSWEQDFTTQTMKWSDAHYRIFGLGRDLDEHSLTPGLFLSLIHPNDREKVARLVPRELKNTLPHFSVDYRIIRPDGTERYIHSEGETTPDSQGLALSIRGTSQDITERKRTEKALDRARREAEFANKAKSEFLSSMSHELRTPMNAILGYAQLLLQTKKDPLHGRQIKQMKQILVSGQHLLKLINDILDLAKIESGHTALETTNVDTFEVITECIDLIRSLAERHEIEIIIQDNLPQNLAVRADRTRLKQALLNLLSNSIKYNQPNGSVKLNIKSTLDEKIQISVEDTGIGIPTERQMEIFEPFSRLGAEQKGIEGTGIGLTITKQLIELMAGEIGFSSRFEEGSTFWIELPSATLKKSPEPHLSPAGSGLQEITGGGENSEYALLYIEDDESNMHLMEEVIDNIPNLILLPATTAEEGLEIARSKQPDIIFMDINLPGMSGLDAMAYLQSQESTKNIPVIALSAAAMPHDLEKGKKVGFFNYLTKPFDIAEVLLNINRALELKDEITYEKNA